MQHTRWCFTKQRQLYKKMHAWIFYETKPLDIETDVSGVALGATLL